MITTWRLAYIQVSDGEISVTATWDSTGINPETGTPDFTGALISVEAVNTSLTRTATALIKRGNGVAVVSRSLPPLTTEIYTGGGPVKKIEDIPYYSIGVIY